MHKQGMSWREIGRFYDVNQRYVYDWGVHGIEPVNRDIRIKLGLEKAEWLKQAVQFLAGREKIERWRRPKDEGRRMKAEK